ncbi:MAG: sulfite exporter TauE/SafE family protein [Bacteroidia bacterium]|nr:sulfite exporter TauE/SafE family protein [Bacteroidia bacterium]MCF8426873.1 sulfite exporter TauE/SafE family protein [Bacteroidia bacterium]
MELLDYVIIALFGSLGAFISGFLGVGGGIVYIPVLDYFLQKSGMHNDMLVKGILANSLFTIIFSGSVSSYNQYKVGNFFPKQILQTALPGMVTAFIITYLIKTGTWYSKTTFNYVFASMLFIIVFRMFATKAKNYEGQPESPAWHYQVTGFFAGIVTAFSGLGGGVIMTPSFTDIMKQNIKKASSISNGVIPLFAIVLGIYNLSDKPAQYISDYQIGYIVLPVVLPLIISTFIFAPIGVRVSQKTSQQVIRMVFATFASLVFIKLIYEIFFK